LPSCISEKHIKVLFPSVQQELHCRSQPLCFRLCHLPRHCSSPKALSSSAFSQGHLTIAIATVFGDSACLLPLLPIPPVFWHLFYRHTKPLNIILSEPPAPMERAGSKKFIAYRDSSKSLPFCSTKHKFFVVQAHFLVLFQALLCSIKQDA